MKLKPPLTLLPLPSLLPGKAYHRAPHQLGDGRRGETPIQRDLHALRLGSTLRNGGHRVLWDRSSRGLVFVRLRRSRAAGADAGNQYDKEHIASTCITSGCSCSSRIVRALCSRTGGESGGGVTLVVSFDFAVSPGLGL